MKNIFIILGATVLVIGLLCLVVLIVQLLGNYILTYFEVPIKRLDFMITLAIILFCGFFFNPYYKIK